MKISMAVSTINPFHVTGPHNFSSVPFLADIYLFQVNNGNTRAMHEILLCSKFTIKTPEQRHWRHSCVFIITFEQTSHIVLVFPLLTLNK